MSPSHHSIACHLRVTTVLFWLAVVCGAARPAGAQESPRWRWSNPAPHGANAFATAYGLSLAVVVGERGQVFVSEDLAYWEPRASGTTNALRAAVFFNERLVITGENGTVLYADSLEDFQVVSLGTANWLEGVAASGSLLVAVGDNAAVYSSSDGAAWSAETIAGATNWLRSVAYGGNNFVAVGEHGFIATRANNGVWTVQNSGTTTHLNKAGYVDGQFVVAGDSGVCLVGSSNLRTWTPFSPALGATNALYALAGTNVPGGLNTLLAAGNREARLRENGGAWSNQITAPVPYPAPDWTYYSASWLGSLYFMAGRSGLMVEGFKTNDSSPTLWVTRADSLRHWLWDLIRTPNFYVAVGDRATVMTSENGVTWNLELVPDAVTNAIWLGIGGTSNGLVAVGNRGRLIYSPNIVTNIVSTNLLGTNPVVVTNPVSTLGVTWLAVPTPTTNDLHAVAFDGSRWVACGAGGTILTSETGANWVIQAAPTNVYFSSVAVFPGGWVVCGDRGAILTSPDGTNWTPRASGTTNWVYRVRYLNGGLIAVGENGTILTSADGAGWARQTSGTTRWLNGVDYAAAGYYAVGNQGAVLSSTNGVQWNFIGTATQKSLYGAASHEGQMVVAGLEGVILRRQLTPLMAPVTLRNFSRPAGQSLILFAAKTDQRFVLQTSENLTDWVDGQTLEVFDPSGTLLFLENVNTNSPSAFFYRALTVP